MVSLLLGFVRSIGMEFVASSDLESQYSKMIILVKH